MSNWTPEQFRDYAAKRLKDEERTRTKIMGDKSKPDEPKCGICGKPLLSGGPWIDDEEYGDVHEACLDEKQNS